MKTQKHVDVKNTFIILGMIMVLFFSSFSVMENANLVFSEDYDELLEFKKWAQTHEIFLVGVNKSPKNLSTDGYDPTTDEILLDDVSNVLIAAEILYTIPDSVLKPMKGKTIYFSTENGTSFALISSHYESIENMNDGMIIGQNISPYSVIHEVGHIMDFEKYHDDYQNQIIKNDLFELVLDEQNYSDLPDGHISYYSLTDNVENFAEHFAYYVVSGEDFREIAGSDVLLDKKYNFLKNYVFNGIEF